MITSWVSILKAYLPESFVQHKQYKLYFYTNLQQMSILKVHLMNNYKKWYTSSFTLT